MVDRGELHHGLFCRLNGFLIEVPPLRNRGDDIELLATNFLRLSATKHAKVAARFSSAVLDVFSRYHWPGNVRQLENLVERLVVHSHGDEIELDSLPSELLDESRS
jgi:DNA-binding NtrC family response regulator